MTRKDYIQIAKVLANRFSKVDSWRAGEEKRATETEIITMTEDFIHMLAQDNPRFDRASFIEYINKEAGTNLLS